MKKAQFILFSFFCVALLLFAGCAPDFDYFGPNATVTMSGSYSHLSGSRSKVVELKTDDKLNLSYRVKVGSGTFVLTILDPNEAEIWQQSLLADANDTFTLTAEKDGAYRISVDFKGSRGTYEVSWKKE